MTFFLYDALWLFFGVSLFTSAFFWPARFGGASSLGLVALSLLLSIKLLHSVK
jgi:hypothetical protein